MRRSSILHLFTFVLLVFGAADFSLAQQSESKLKLAAPISNHMVLQQGQSTSVWGRAAAQEKVMVEFAGQSVATTSDDQGDWLVRLSPLTVSAKPATMTVKSGAQEITVSDILVGEVWMCSGQSNMVWPMKRTREETIKKGDLPQVRFFNATTRTALQPQKDCVGEWRVMTQESGLDFSAVGFAFGRELYEKLGVPIGLVNTAWGGKPVESFASYEKLQTVPGAKPLLEEWKQKAANYDAKKAKSEFDTALAKWKTRVEEIRAAAKAKGDEKPKLPRRPNKAMQPELDSNHPASIFNQNVAPFTNYAVAGTIWYQGESNRDRAVQYEALLTGMIQDWRSRWGNEKMPFYIVQLANYLKPSTEPGTADAWAELQDAQTKVARATSHCDIVVINEIGEANNIHPKNKHDVGMRLAMLALKNDYGKDIKGHASPLFKSHQVSGDQVTVQFDYEGQGLKSRDGGALKRFEIAGEDRVWHWAEATIDASGKSVIVKSDQVKAPIAVRYAWAANPTGANLVNSSGLPASIFRTDDWPLSTVGVLTRADADSKKNGVRIAKNLKKRGFVSMLNGRDLSGWRNPYDHGQAMVVGDEVHLTGDKKFFLVTEDEYDDFELHVEIKLPVGQANSGVMFRCHVEPNKVFGYQAECDGSDRRWSAGLYDEGRRKWIWPCKPGNSKKEFMVYEEKAKAHFAKPKIRNALNRTGWNRYLIRCQGDSISIRLNGVEVTNLKDEEDAKGFIGIQHHGEKGQTYKFRNLFIKPLK